jgi:hypothetical protein
LYRHVSADGLRFPAACPGDARVHAFL